MLRVSNLLGTARLKVSFSHLLALVFCVANPLRTVNTNKGIKIVHRGIRRTK